MTRRPSTRSRAGAVAAAVVLSVGGCAGEPEPAPPPAPAAHPPAGTAPGTPPPGTPPPGTLPPGAPDRIELPPGFAPEGIAIGPDAVAYLGERNTGAIYRVELATGRGRVVAPATGRGVQGLKLDAAGRLYAAGRDSGTAVVYDTGSGAVLATYRLVDRPTEDDNLVNDDLLTADAWWLTDSRNPVLYRLPRHPDGRLPSQAEVRTVPLTGAMTYRDGVNANGIAPTPDGRALMVAQSNTGRLFRVDPGTGATTAVDLGGADLADGDGLLLAGRTLYVVQHDSATLTVVELDDAGTRGRVTGRITDPRFDGPTTVAAAGERLYLPNARFDAPEAPSTRYDVVAVPRPG